MFEYLREILDLRGMNKILGGATLSKYYCPLLFTADTFQKLESKPFQCRLIFRREFVYGNANKSSQKCVPFKMADNLPIISSPLYEKALSQSRFTSRKHAYIILTPLNPTYI